MCMLTPVENRECLNDERFARPLARPALELIISSGLAHIRHPGGAGQARRLDIPDVCVLGYYDLGKSPEQLYLSRLSSGWRKSNTRPGKGPLVASPSRFV
jgi:hypothetical protein